MAKKLIATGMLSIVVILAGLAILTLLPFTASKGNDLGYVSLCPLAPWSTLMLLLGAAIFWAVRNYITTRVN